MGSAGLVAQKLFRPQYLFELSNDFNEAHQKNSTSLFQNNRTSAQNLLNHEGCLICNHL